MGVVLCFPSLCCCSGCQSGRSSSHWMPLSEHESLDQAYSPASSGTNMHVDGGNIYAIRAMARGDRLCGWYPRRNAQRTPRWHATAAA